MKQICNIYIAVVIAVASTLVGCGGGQRAELRASKGDSLIFAAGSVPDYQRVLALADSLEASGDISVISANRWRGVAYFYQGQFRSSEFYYKAAVSAPVRTEQDQLNHDKSARRLAALLVKKADYDGALRVALDAVEELEKSERGTDADRALLLNTIGCCQLNLGMGDEARTNFNQSYQLLLQIAKNDNNGRRIYQAFMGTCDIADQYQNTRHYLDAQRWLERADELLTRYEGLPTADSSQILKYRPYLNMHKAIILQNLGLSAEAAKAYRAALGSIYAKTTEGRIMVNEYLMAARKYREAADNFRDLDQLLGEGGIALSSLDNIQHYLLPKYRANVWAMRRDSAVAVGTQICNMLDSAILLSKKTDAAELATIYDTREKEAEIARQKADLTRAQFIGMFVAMALLVIFFTIYTLHRRKAQHRLSMAHVQLQEAYDQLEATTAAKERIESELRIARDIQMSMVPNVFPDQPGLDIFAAMTPAKEVGGDLYGYLQLENQLYFCIGDVSGKGVPASLFMAQATRLFRTLASQHMMPAEMATRMNAALTEDNEQGMFVTMFIGLVDLVTGHLDFCNAGHNPPVIMDLTHADGQEASCFLEVESNAPIGLWPGLDFDGEAIDNIKGKLLFVYSDGLTEAEDTRQRQFGDDRLLQILNEFHDETSRQVVDRLQDEVEKHRKGAEPNDDLTMMCLKVVDAS